MRMSALKIMQILIYFEPSLEKCRNHFDFFIYQFLVISVINPKFFLGRLDGPHVHVWSKQDMVQIIDLKN